MVVIIELVSMIIGNPATGAGSAAGMNPIDTVELVAIVIASIIFAYFAIIISLVSYRRRKELNFGKFYIALKILANRTFAIRIL